MSFTPFLDKLRRLGKAFVNSVVWQTSGLRSNDGRTKIVERLDALDARLERVSVQLDFVRTHISNYLGDGIALTYLIDDTPIYVNANDDGCPINFINGGRYEEDNLAILLSFVRPNTIFLDIGANIGFFSLRVGRHLARTGKVHAFEPHPKAFELLCRSAYLNGLGHVIECHNYGLSDCDERVTFQFPVRHLGGGSVGAGDASGRFATIESQVRRLDGVFDSEFQCNLVKIDVEGHELQVLQGMRAIVERSRDITILFEKLGLNVGSEAGLKDYFDSVEMKLFGAGEGARLVELPTLQSFSDWGGYVLASRDFALRAVTQRERFTLYPAQLHIIASSKKQTHSLCEASLQGLSGEMLFHGPYWFLPRGVWEITINGTIVGQIGLTIAERFGYRVSELKFAERSKKMVFTCKRDLVNFECVARVSSLRASIDLDSVEFVRLG